MIHYFYKDMQLILCIDFVAGHSATLIYCFLELFCKLLGFLIIMSLADKDILTYCFILDPLISFSCLIVVAKTSNNTMLNKSGDNGHSCLVPDLNGNVFGFLPLRIILDYGLLLS